MASLKGISCLFKIFGSYQQIGACHRRIHSACVIRPDHGFNPDFVENALGDLGIGGRPEYRNGDQVCGFHLRTPRFKEDSKVTCYGKAPKESHYPVFVVYSVRTE